jgi:hypothetical protein
MIGGIQMWKKALLLTCLFLVAAAVPCGARNLIWCYSDDIRTVYFDKDETWRIRGELVHTLYVIRRTDGSRLECVSNFDAYRNEYELFQYDMDADGNERFIDRRGNVFRVEKSNAPIYELYRKLLSYYPI